MSMTRLVRSTKLGLMAATLAAGTVFGASCGLSDIKDNLVAGSLNFVKSYTADAWDLIIPNLNELFPAIPSS